MKGEKLIIEGNAFYQIDRDCEERKAREKGQRASLGIDRICIQPKTGTRRSVIAARAGIPRFSAHRESRG